MVDILPDVSKYLGGDVVNSFLRWGSIIGEVILIGGITAAILYMVINAKRYLYNVLIFREDGKIEQDKGAILKDRFGGERFKLKKKKVDIPVPDLRYFHPDDRGKTTIALERYGVNDFVPVDIIVNPHGAIDLHPANSDMEFWRTQMHRDITNKYSHETFWQKYGNQLILVVGMTLVLIMLWMTLGKVEIISSSLSAASDKIAEAIRYGGGQVINVPS